MADNTDNTEKSGGEILTIREYFDALIEDNTELVKRAKEDMADFLSENAVLPDYPIKLSETKLVPGGLINLMVMVIADTGAYIDDLFEKIADKTMSNTEVSEEGFTPIGHLRMCYGFTEDGVIEYNTAKGWLFKDEFTKKTSDCITHPSRRDSKVLESWLTKAMYDEVLSVAAKAGDGETLFDTLGVTAIILSKVTLSAKFEEGIFVFKAYVEHIHSTNSLAVAEVTNKIMSPVSKYRVSEFPFCWSFMLAGYKFEKEGQTYWGTHTGTASLGMRGKTEIEEELQQSWIVQQKVRERLAAVWVKAEELC